MTSAAAALWLGVPSGARAQDGVCSPPISTCAEVVIQGRDGPQVAPQIFPPPPVCPEGYACTCVPSCPECDDCAARVCVPEKPSPECRTACDCETGLACIEGRCIAGFAPVFCCDADFCPTGEQCQQREGSMERCGDADRCEARRRQVAKRIARWVERAGACRQDSDCAFVDTSTGCQGTCGEFIRRRLVRPFGRRLSQLDERLCSSYVADGCPYATPGCLERRAVCVQGRCTGVAAPLPGATDEVCR